MEIKIIAEKKNYILTKEEVVASLKYFSVEQFYPLFELMFEEFAKSTKEEHRINEK